MIRRWYRIDVYYYVDIREQPMIFSWYINEYTITKDVIGVHAYNWISYLQHRIVRNQVFYDHKSISYVVQDLLARINEVRQLPFSVQVAEDMDKVVSLRIDKGATLFDALETVYESCDTVQYRVVGSHKEGIRLEVGEEVGDLLDGVWLYNEKETNKANIQGRQWKETTTSYWNYMMSKNGMHTKEVIDEEDVNEVWLLFEKYENDSNINARVSTHNPVVPSLEVMPDQKWWKMQVGDRRAVRLLTGYKQVQLDYIALIQARSISVGSGGIAVQIKISDKYMKQTNVLDTILTNMQKEIKKS